jgi:hypothetical protein
VAIWLIPPVAIFTAARERDRWLLDAGLALALVTLITNKPYLGLSPRPWDPILLGALLIAVAVLLRRWLASGRGGERNGYTAVQVLESEGLAIRAAGLASTTVQPEPAGNAPHEDHQFAGGRSGGGGGGADF